MFCDFYIASFSSACLKGFLSFLELLDLKLRLCFSALVLKVQKCRLELLRDEFAKKVSASVSSMSFWVVASVLFLCGV